MTQIGELIVLGQVVGTVGLGWLYFRRFALTRPPIGVFNLADVGQLLVGIVVLPLLYLALPSWLAGGLLAFGSLSALFLLAEPVLRSRWALWLALGAVLAAELLTAFVGGTDRPPFRLVNNAVVMLTAIAFANLWAQSGLKARDAAVLGAGLAVYDVIATSWLPLMGDLLARVGGFPFAPLLAWPMGNGEWLGIGLGDLLLATVFPLVMRKAYGVAAGLGAMALSLGGIVFSLTLTRWAELGIFPVMVVLGPLMVLQYVAWARRRGPERTTVQYLRAEPLRIQAGYA
jgi:hypothetical protein